MTTLITTQEKMDDIMRIVKYLEQTNVSTGF